MKQIYQIIINGEPARKPFYLCHESDKKRVRIEFAVAKQKAVIVAHDSSYTAQCPLDPEKCIAGVYRNYAWALKKVMLFHYILHSSELVIRTIRILCRDERTGELIYDRAFAFNKTNRPIATVVTGNLEPFPDSWQQPDVLAALAKVPLAEKEPAWRIVVAQIMRHGRQSEMEKFTYNWTAFNTMYAWLLAAVRSIYPAYPGQGNDQPGLILWGKVTGLQFIKQHDGSAKRVRDIVMQQWWDPTTVTTDLRTPSSDLYQRVKAQLYLGTTLRANEPRDRIKPIRVEPYDFFLLRFCYWFRCELFHGSRPLPILSFAHEQNLNSLTAVNGVLDDVIAEYFPRCLTEGFIEKNAAIQAEKQMRQDENNQKNKLQREAP